MAAHKGTIVIYATNSGEVPAVTLAHYDVTGALVDDTAANAVTADLNLLNYQSTHVTGVLKDSVAGTFANVGKHTALKYYVPS